MKVNPSLLIACAPYVPFLGRMERLAERIRQRLAETGMTQADLARIMEMSLPRIGNYYHGRRPPDIATLARLARALQTSTDWLLGLSEARPAEAKPVFLRLLQLDGMPEAKAEVLAETAATALRLLSSFPDEGDERTRAHLAAQAAWQIKPAAKPH